MGRRLVLQNIQELTFYTGMAQNHLLRCDVLFYRPEIASHEVPRVASETLSMIPCNSKMQVWKASCFALLPKNASMM